MYSNGGTMVVAGGSRQSVVGSRQSLAGSVYGSSQSIHGSNIVLVPVVRSDQHGGGGGHYVPRSTGTLVTSSSSHHHHHHHQKPRVTADMAISNFHIEFDKSVAVYRPGETMKGKVIMDVWTALDIMYIEFKIQGFATVRQFNDSGDGFTGKPVQEYYINKRIMLVSPPEGRSSLSLQQGKYVSEFSYKLPQNIPPTVSQFDLGRGFVFDISYIAKANVCDLMKQQRSSPSSTSPVARVVKSSKATFAVASALDNNNHSGEEAIVHSEQIQLFCSPFNSDPTSVLVQLNKSFYCVGEYIKVHIEVLTPNKKRIRKLITELEQSVTINTGKKKSTRFQQTLIKAVDDGRGRRLVPKSHENNPSGKLDMVKTGFRLPLPPNFVPSLLPGCDIIHNNYCIKVTVKFRRLGGELIERIPITVAPLPENPFQKTSEPLKNKHNIPLFNKPIMQFPYFAKDNQGRDSMRSNRSTGDASSTDTFVGKKHDSKYERVNTQYKTCITCCGCCLLCLGYGIYN